MTDNTNVPSYNDILLNLINQNQTCINKSKNTIKTKISV